MPVLVLGKVVLLVCKKSALIMSLPARTTNETPLNPIWIGLFANLKAWGGGKMPPPLPKLAISSQVTMKLGKDILWVEIFTN